MNLSQLKVSTRLTLGFAAVILLVMIMAAMGLRSMSHIRAQLEEVVNDNIFKMGLVQDMSESVHIVSRVMRTLVLLEDAGQIDAEMKKIEVARQKYDEARTALEKTPASETGAAIRARMKEARETARPLNNKVIDFAKQNRDVEAVALLMSEAGPATQKWQDALDENIAFQKQMNERDAKLAQEEYDQALLSILILAGIAIAIGAAAAIVITRSITKQLGGEPVDAVAVADRIASGDLGVQIKIADNDQGSLMHAIKEMRDSLVTIVGQVRTGTDTITTASAEIAKGNLDLSSRTEQQASSLEETAASMEELTSTVKQNADNARQANQLAASASDIAAKGGDVVAQVVHTMEDINESAKKIVDIISVIDGIAFQTNILALNAAVEAARAGEQGRGFAVVASEVRSLAQRSASAAKEIKELIGNSVEKVDAGSKLVGQAGSTMQEIVESVKRVTDIMTEITAASQEQSTGIEQVNQAIAQMDQVTQQNAALVEEAAAAAESMQNQAAQLTQAVSVFKTSGMPSVALPQAKRAAISTPAYPRSAKPAPSKDVKPVKPALAAPTGSADDWEEF